MRHVLFCPKQTNKSAPSPMKKPSKQTKKAVLAPLNSNMNQKPKPMTIKEESLNFLSRIGTANERKVMEILVYIQGMPSFDDPLTDDLFYNLHLMLDTALVPEKNCEYLCKEYFRERVNIDAYVEPFFSNLDHSDKSGRKMKKNYVEKTCTSNMKLNHTECSICLSKFCNGEKIIVLPCKHTFHRDCVSKWIDTHDECPYCRYKL